MDPQNRLHRELIGRLRQHSAFCDQRHLLLLGWKVAGLLLSQTVCFDRWNRVLPQGVRRRLGRRPAYVVDTGHVDHAGRTLLAWIPIELPPRPRKSQLLAIA